MLENFRLRVFRAVAEHLSFRKAGEALFLTQPAVTLQIKALEDELRTKLFERSAAGVELTEAGRILVPYAERLHQLAEEAEHSIAELGGDAAGELAVGASTTIAQYVIPSLLADFARTYSSVQLRLSSDNTERIAEGVAQGRFRLGLIEGPALRRDVKVERWFDDELLLIVPSSHEWAGLDSINAEQLSDSPLVMREHGSGTRHVIEQALTKAGFRLKSLRIVMELDSTEAILSCIEAGLGVGFVSQWAIARRLSANALAALHVAGLSITRSFSLVTPQGPDVDYAASTLLRFLRARIPPVPGQGVQSRVRKPPPRRHRP